MSELQKILYIVFGMCFNGVISILGQKPDECIDIVLGDDALLSFDSDYNVYDDKVIWKKDNFDLTECGAPNRLHLTSTNYYNLTIKNTEMCDLGNYESCLRVNNSTVCKHFVVALLVFRGASGDLGGNNFYGLWKSADSANVDKPEARTVGSKSNLHYKSSLVEKWNENDFIQVRLRVYRDGQEKAYFVFDGENSGKMSWMSEQRLLYSSYNDLKGCSCNYFSVDGHVSTNFFNPNKRRFFINLLYTTFGCNDQGWLAVIEQDSVCGWDNGNLPKIMYSKYSTVTLWDEGETAEEMTISVVPRAQVRVDHSTTDMEHLVVTDRTKLKTSAQVRVDHSSIDMEHLTVTDRTKLKTSGLDNEVSKEPDHQNTVVPAKSTMYQNILTEKTNHQTTASMQMQGEDEWCRHRCTKEEKTSNEFWNSLQGLNKDELQVKMKPVLEKLTRELKVNKSNLSSFKRKHTSAPDHRQSSKDIGLVGIIFLSSVIGIITIMDILWARAQQTEVNKRRRTNNTEPVISNMFENSVADE